MCEPTTLMILSTITQVAGGLAAGASQAQAHEYDAAVNEQNAILADRRAKDAVERGQLEENRKLREGTYLRKEQQQFFAGGNIDAGYGSALDIITSSAMAAEMDAALIRTNAEREAEDYEVQGVNYRNQARQDRRSAQGARTGAIFKAAGTVLDGGAGVFKYQASIA